MSDRYEDFNALAEMLGCRARVDIRGDMRDVVAVVIDAVNFLMADSLQNRPIFIPEDQFDRMSRVMGPAWSEPRPWASKC